MLQECFVDWMGSPDLLDREPIFQQVRFNNVKIFLFKNCAKNNNMF